MLSLLAKIKGGSSPSGGKRIFGSRQKFMTAGVARGSKNWPSENFVYIVHSASRNLNFN